MVLTHTPVCDFGLAAPDFSLPDTTSATDRIRSRDEIVGETGLLVMFICNHCPYVQSILERIMRDARDLQALGVGVVAISPNDPAEYPQDSPENMARLAAEQGFTFPYLFDESQSVAKAYGAVCTPDFFGYAKTPEGLSLQYRGRLDASGRQAAGPEVRRDLFESMKLVAETGRGPADQIPSMGCSIKWK